MNRSPENSSMPRPDLSIVVVAYNMRREAARTLHSLSRAYQRGIDDLSYEVIVVDNGSTEPLDPGAVAAHGPEFRLVAARDPGRSPLPAANRGVAESAGAVVGVVLDGACLVTPGTIAAALRAQRAYGHAFATTYAWQLGTDLQQRAVQEGYDQSSEDRLLAEAGWPEDGYAVFRQAVLDPSNPDGWFGPISESRFFVLPSAAWEDLGGYDERFQAVGGGLGGIDLFRRVCDRGDLPIVGLLGEGSFHQVHGGVTTSSPVDRFSEYHDEYVRIHGRAWEMPRPPMQWLGAVGEAARRWLEGAQVADDVRRQARIQQAAVPLQGGRVVEVMGGLHGDGWVERTARCRIVPVRDSWGVEITGWLAEHEFEPMPLVVRAGDARPHAVRVIPGRFLVDAPVRLAAGAEVELALEAGRALPPEMLGAGEDRALSWQVESIRLRGPTTDPRILVSVDGAHVVEALGGFYDDGWVAKRAGCTLEAVADASALRIGGWLPEQHAAPSPFAVSVDGAAARVFDVGPGAFVAEVPLDLRSRARASIQIACDAGLPDPPATETRPLSWRVEHLALL
jgi:hypothetical protein